MTILSNHRSFPGQDACADRTIATTADMVEMLKRSNHATAFAGWTVATIAMGLVIQVDTVRAVHSAPAIALLAGLLLPVLATTGHVMLLLSRAARIATEAGAVGLGEHAGTPHDATERLTYVIAMMKVRDSLARRALIWAYGSGAGFLAWSLLDVIVAARW